MTILQLHAQGLGIFAVPAEVLSMLPYLATVLVLVLINAGPWRRRHGAPGSLGRAFRPAA